MIIPSRSELIVCATSRLARSLRQSHAQSQLALGLKEWQPLNVKTLDHWLDEVLNLALLTGEIAPEHTPQKRLTLLEERLIWQAVIAAQLKIHSMPELFDLKGLADACIEANRYMVAWKLALTESHQALAEESRQFLHWQQAFLQRCEQLNALENVRYFDWLIKILAKGAGQLPSEIAFAGFDQNAPQEIRLRETLIARGCNVKTLAIGLANAGQCQHVQLLDERQEIRSMVAWASAQYAENPQIKLAMVVPKLAQLRNQIADLIDDVFQPQAVRPSLVEAPRLYNFSLGLALAQQPIIQTALNLIRLFCHYEVNQDTLSPLLRASYWSASLTESDQRALLDAAMREYLPHNFSWVRLLSFIKTQSARLNIVQLRAHLEAGHRLMGAQNKKQSPSNWADFFNDLLTALHWSGERSDSSHEYQAKKAWAKALQALSQLDFLRDKLSAQTAYALLQQICQEQVFQPETSGEPPLQIVGIMEALSAPVDAMWVMGMNDMIWPLPARPNPLIPAQIQRAARVANADNAVQTAFALSIHQRLMHSASRIIFSSALQEAEKALRPSPLMAKIPVSLEAFLPANTLAETLAQVANKNLQWLDDAIAPSVEAGEHVRGGTGLMRAQAICPAWAFYQFRLGAKALKSPKNGLDAAERGQLVHNALEAFWRNGGQYRHFLDLQNLAEAALDKAIELAVDQSISQFTQTHEAIFSVNTLLLERERIVNLLANWLAFEKLRDIEFKMLACEVEKKVEINGIEVTLKIDRIHQLADGGLELVDYKTGQLPAIKSWGELRITEPQLPIYAVFYGADAEEISGVQLARVKIKAHQFMGLSVANFDEALEKRKPDFIRNFNDWAHLKAHWKTCIENIAQEIKTGIATVVIENEDQLQYCDVLPLLRLPERHLQFERQLQFGEKNQQIGYLHE